MVDARVDLAKRQREGECQHRLDERAADVPELDEILPQEPFEQAERQHHDAGDQAEDERAIDDEADVEDAVRLIRSLGADRFLFGSDGPRFLLQPQLEQILALDLTDDERQMILAGNAKRVYRIGD